MPNQLKHLQSHLNEQIVTFLSEHNHRHYGRQHPRPHPHSLGGSSFGKKSKLRKKMSPVRTRSRSYAIAAASPATSAVANESKPSCRRTRLNAYKPLVSINPGHKLNHELNTSDFNRILMNTSRKGTKSGDGISQGLPISLQRSFSECQLESTKRNAEVNGKVYEEKLNCKIREGKVTRQRHAVTVALQDRRYSTRSQGSPKLNRREVLIVKENVQLVNKRVSVSFRGNEGRSQGDEIEAFHVPLRTGNSYDENGLILPAGVAHVLRENQKTLFSVDMDPREEAEISVCTLGTKARGDGNGIAQCAIGNGGEILSFADKWECPQAVAPFSSGSVGPAEHQAFPVRLSANVEDLEKPSVFAGEERTGSTGEAIEEDSERLGNISVEGSEQCFTPRPQLCITPDATGVSASQVSLMFNERGDASAYMSSSDVIYDCCFTPKAQQFKIPETKFSGEHSYAFANVSGDVTDRCSTPRAQEFKIPEVFLCPQAPRKRKGSYGCSYAPATFSMPNRSSQRMRSHAFFLVPDFDAFFGPPCHVRHCQRAQVSPAAIRG